MTTMTMAFLATPTNHSDNGDALHNCIRGYIPQQRISQTQRTPTGGLQLCASIATERPMARNNIRCQLALHGRPQQAETW
jgi:hypothetical protein